MSREQDTAEVAIVADPVADARLVAVPSGLGRVVRASDPRNLIVKLR